MTILFAASELAGLTPSDSSVVEDSGSGTFYTPYSRAAVRLGSTAGYAFTPRLGAQSLWWQHWAVVDVTGFGNGVYSEWLNNAGISMIKMQSDGSIYNFTFWNGSTYAATAGGISINAGALNQYDIKITAGSGFKVYVAGTLRYDSIIDGGVASMPAVTDIASFRKHCVVNFSSNSWVSEVIITNSEPTVGWRLLSDGAFAAGGVNSFSGSYANVNEIVLDDTNYVNSTTAGDVSTYAYPAPAVTSFSIKAVVLGFRAKTDSGGPQNMLGVARIGGTNYTKTIAPALDVGYLGSNVIYATNPATGVAWLPGDLSSTELGMQSAA